MACSSALALQYDMQAGNEELAEIVTSYKPILGYVYVTPVMLEESIVELDRYCSADGFVGAKVHPRLSGVPSDDPRMSQLVNEVAQRTDVLLVHTVDRYAARAMAEHARVHAKLNIILGHAGHTDSDEVARLAADIPNVYLDFCCEWAGSGKVRRALDICGAESIVLGTDSDLLAPAYTLGMFEEAELGDADRRMIFRDNAARLFGLSE